MLASCRFAISRFAIPTRNPSRAGMSLPVVSSFFSTKTYEAGRGVPWHAHKPGRGSKEAKAAKEAKFQGGENGRKEQAFMNLEAKSIEPECGIYGSIGEEISGKKLDPNAMIITLNQFYQLPSVRELARTHYMDDKLFKKAFVSFRSYCYKSSSLPPELHIKFCDIIDSHGHASDLFPFFLTHAREAFPHLECHLELRKISDLGLPHIWYPEARSKIRKIYFHSGPTNSGKTYTAMERFLNARSGIYCGPLKLLAVEIYHKANDKNVPCDLITGDDRKIANPDGVTSSPHVSCTIEMASVENPVEVVVIDEIQMLRDPQRGWAWTRALLGIAADEVHLCGEEAALDVVRRILMPTCDTIEVVRYKRLTPLVLEDKAIGDLKNVRNGDCVVCFSKDSLFQTSMKLESLGHQVALVYGALPPDTKLAQCKRFNESQDCNIMVATDAIGMGLNLSIGRIIFSTLVKTVADTEGNRKKELISTSHCLQIAGRAGRFKTAHETGYATTLNPEDIKTLHEIMSNPVPPIERAGLHPTAEMIELFAYHLPHLSLSNLIDLFVDLCEFDSSAYFICDMKNFKALAENIQHIEMPLRSKYLFCCAPINLKTTFSVAMFTKFARQFSCHEPITADWMKKNVGWPLKPPRKIDELMHLEVIFDVFEIYLWLSNRFRDMFPAAEEIRELQEQVDSMISSCVGNIGGLIRAAQPVPRGSCSMDYHLKKRH